MLQFILLISQLNCYELRCHGEMIKTKLLHSDGCSVYNIESPFSSQNAKLPRLNTSKCMKLRHVCQLVGKIFLLIYFSVQLVILPLYIWQSQTSSLPTLLFRPGVSNMSLLPRSRQFNINQQCLTCTVYLVADLSRGGWRGN